MSLTFAHDCQFCSTRQIGFTGRFDWKIPNANSQKYLLATCNGCASGVIFCLLLTKQTTDHPLVKLLGDLDSNGIKILNFWPEVVSSQISEDVPRPIASLCEQAVRCFRQEAWDAAGMTLRKALDISTKTLDPSLSSKPLAKRIDLLHDVQRLTPQVRDWAHEIRLDGNEAAHDDDPFTKNQVESLNEFMKAYLKYIYELPAMVERSRERRNGNIDSPSPNPLP